MIENVYIATLVPICICKQCGTPYEYPRAKPGGCTSTILKHSRKHVWEKLEAAQKANIPRPDIRKLLQGPALKVQLTQEEFEVMCLNAMVVSNWSFSQFKVGAFRELLDAGFELEVPSPKVMRARLKKYAKQTHEEIKARLTSNESRISLVLDCWTSANRLEFMSIYPLLLYMLIIAITGHYIDENFILQEDLPDFGEVDWSHSGVNLADHLHKVLTIYGICEKLFCITTDNASNNDIMCEELSDLLYESHEMDWNGEENHIACLAHVINLAV
jgi:hypothetical protein